MPMDAGFYDHSLVDEVMRQWPATISIFLRHGMRCVGCPIGRLHSIQEACIEHHVDVDLFMADLQATITARSQSESPSPPMRFPP